MYIWTFFALVVLNLELLLILLAQSSWNFLVLHRDVTHHMRMSLEGKYEINCKWSNCCSFLLCFFCFYLPLAYFVLNIAWLSAFFFSLPLIWMSLMTRKGENWMIRIVRRYPELSLILQLKLSQLCLFYYTVYI